VISLWWEILKNAKLSGKAKSKGTTLDSNRIKIERPKTDCNTKLKEWASKLKNYNLLMKKGFEKDEFMQKHFEVQTDVEEEFFKKIIIKKKGSQMGHLLEMVYFYYHPVPEEVACKAIDMLEKDESGTDSLEIDGIQYSWYFEKRVDDNYNKARIGIVEDGNIKVMLGWRNAVYSTKLLSDGSEEYQWIPLAKNLSGYYETGKFGFSLWK